MDNSITSIETRTIGEEGFTSDVMLITLTYQTPTPGLPERIVAKYSGGDVTAVKGAAKYILHNVIFPNEIKFFSSAKLVGCPARFPRSYFASSFKQNHFMLMEDLSFARCGDGQQEGGATFEESVQVFTWLGRLHGHYWGRRGEEGCPNEVQNFFAGSDWTIYPGLLQKLYPSAIKTAMAAYSEEFENIGDGEGGGKVLKVLTGRMKGLARRLRTPPFTLCHGDVKLDNLFFEHIEETDSTNVIGCDWGVTGWGNNMSDIAYWFGRSVEPDNRRLWMDDLLKVYHAELVKTKPDLATSYTESKMREDLVWGVWTPFLTMCGVMKSQADNVKNKKGIFGPEAGMSYVDKFKKAWYKNSFVRTSELMKDLGTLDALGGTPRSDPGLPVIPCCCAWTV